MYRRVGTLLLVASTPKPFTPRQERFGRRLTRFFSKINIWVYRKSNGRFGASLRKAPVCLLTTTGRKSGLARTVPLIYLEDRDRVLMVASQGGMSTHPDWYLNLVASPRVTVDIEGDAQAMLARTATPEERAEYWPKLVALYKGYEGYQARTDREIPVVICTPGS